VYDVANDFGDGHGRLRIVNVNSNTEESRIDAFVEAVKEDEKPAPKTSFGARRTPDERARALLDGTNRILPGTPRATVNAVSVLGSGGLDAVSDGTLRAPARPGDILPGTSDLKLAPGANRYANVGRSPAAVAKAEAPAGHGTAPAGHEPPPAAAAPVAPGGHGEAADGHAPAGHGAAPKKGGLNIPGSSHEATPPGRKAGADAHGEAAKPHAPEKSESGHH